MDPVMGLYKGMFCLLGQYYRTHPLDGLGGSLGDVMNEFPNRPGPPADSASWTTSGDADITWTRWQRNYASYKARGKGGMCPGPTGVAAFATDWLLRVATPKRVPGSETACQSCWWRRTWPLESVGRRSRERPRGGLALS